MRRSALVLIVLALTGSACAVRKDTGFPPPEPTETETGPSPEGTGPVELAGPIEVVDSLFQPAAAKVKAGTAVEWSQSGTQPHSVTSDPGQSLSFDSHPGCLQDLSKCMKAGDEFPFTFETPGEYRYYCVIHGQPGGIGMAGVVIVE
jgi:plastocyanin